VQNSSRIALQRRSRRLRVTETVSLGDKRFVSILEVDGRSFLIGGGAGNVSLLSTLPSQSFHEVLTETWQSPEAQ
jgi:flagellar biogenesis protein FliO